MADKVPNRAQTTEVARRNGLAGKKRSPWSKGPMIDTKKNRERQRE